MRTIYGEAIFAISNRREKNRRGTSNAISENLNAF